jgi:hypothetical protein
MVLKSREPPSSLVCLRTSGQETLFLAIATLVMLPVLSYKPVREATLRIVVVLRAEVHPVLLVSAARPKYVHEAAPIVIHSIVLTLYRVSVAILRSIALHLTAKSTLVQVAMPIRHHTAQALPMMPVANLEASSMAVWESASA